mgnify:CR=1 FL=1
MPAPEPPAIDSDVDLHVPGQRRELVGHHVAVLASIAAGGALGACARFGVGLALPTPPGGFPLATWLINIVGCVLIGVLMVVITELGSAHRLVRPFLGVGVLGGFTTFSTYVLEALSLARDDQTRVIALGYLVATWLGVWATRAAARVLGAPR